MYIYVYSITGWNVVFEHQPINIQLKIGVVIHLNFEIKIPINVRMWMLEECWCK